MNIFRTLRFKLTLLYLLFIVTPFIISAFALPYYIKGLLTDETQKLTSGTLSALSRNIETYLDDLDRLSTSPYLSDDVMNALKIKANNSYPTASAYTRLVTDRALTGTLPIYLINTRPDILSTLIVPVKGQAYLTSKDPIELDQEFPFRSQDWYKKAVESDGKAVFISSHSQNYVKDGGKTQVFSVARLIKDPDSRAPLAVILADADKILLEKIAKDVTFNVSSTIVVLDQEDHLLYANKALPDELSSHLTDFKQNDQFESASYTGVSRKVSPADWRIVVFLSNAELKAKIRWIYIVALCLSAGALIITFCVFLYFSKWIVKPFKKMNLIMHKVKKGDMSERFQPRGRDEIAQLGLSLNNMISRLDELINEEFRSKLAQQDAEYRALQSQIRPHFLYNTLNGFIGLNRAGLRSELETAILSLSSMMRYSLEENQQTTIEKEFVFLEKYGVLQQLRFQDRLSIHIECEPEAASWPLPKLLVQPLIENAVIHGVEPDDKINVVNVSAKVELEEDGRRSAVIRVSDNGVGFDPEARPVSGQVGLSNVRARLQLSCPDASLDVISQLGQGTTVTIRIPEGGNRL
ncbi:cache domain-containing sensor histidine kinase [Cohnella zeiphila]|uniref:Sensor histidine kinase n=1 Tax=Cohnella zeiphila TaxID=2761120 RepID=A0A7X0VUE9_9BACL|nr:sensor histidine kinase [Cohnella zeiphila]MBB6730944.1 sensor histidine kinase [Cohnella zeiphila]